MSRMLPLSGELKNGTSQGEKSIERREKSRKKRKEGEEKKEGGTWPLNSSRRVRSPNRIPEVSTVLKYLDTIFSGHVSTYCITIAYF